VKATTPEAKGEDRCVEGLGEEAEDQQDAVALYRAGSLSDVGLGDEAHGGEDGGEDA